MPYDPAISLLGRYPEKNINLKMYIHPKVHSSTIYNNQDEEKPKCPSKEEWLKKKLHTYNEILLSHKKNEIICSNMDGPRDYHIKWSKSYREREILYGITSRQNLNYDTNELTYEIETD